MTLARTGIVVAVAGGIALAGHARLLAQEAQQRSHCDAWRKAQMRIVAPDRRVCAFPSERRQEIVTTALNDPDMQSLWDARLALGCDPELVWMLIPALRDPTFVGLRHPADVHVTGREKPFHGLGVFIRDDLFRRAGRASWLLKEATGHPAPDVRVHTDQILLADIARDWQQWLEELDLPACGL